MKEDDAHEQLFASYLDLKVSKKSSKIQKN